MQAIAKAQSVKVSPRKVRLVADVIRGKKVAEAQRSLLMLDQRGAAVLQKVLSSALANATHNAKLAVDTLIIKRLEVTEGPALKRFHPSTRGRVHPYKRKSSHITVVLEEMK